MSGEDACRVLVVEDELPILDNLIQKIEASPLPFSVVGGARDGESGLAFLRENPVDLLVTDVRMPVMDGLKLLKEARELYPALKVLIVSGYDEFSYAQEALRHGASDYLLKPVSADSLNKALEKMYADLRQAGRRREREIVTSGLAGAADFADVPSSLTHRRYGLHLIAVGNLARAGAAPTNEQIGFYWEKANLPELVRHFSSDEDGWWLVDEPSPHAKMLISVLPSDTFGALLYRGLADNIAGLFPVTVCSADEQVPANQIWRVAQQLRDHLKAGLRPCYSAHLKAGQTPPPPDRLDSDLPGALALCVKTKSVDRVSDLVTKTLAQWRAAHLPQVLLEEGLRSIFGALTDEWADAAEKAYGIIACNVEEDAMYAELCDLADALLDHSSFTQNASQALYLHVREYIDNHYLEPITMESIAESYHFSPSYISRVFKKHANQPPFRYLLTLRIREAKRLIRLNGEMSFQIVSEMTGFTDPHYFSRVFRSLTGMSPSEYRKSVIKSPLSR